MQIVTNEKLIKRNARIGQITGLVGLGLLVLGAFYSFQNPEQVGISFGALLAGFALSQIGIYFGNRYARRPRPDEELNKALKGLNRSYTLYHYNAPATHLLIGPAGIWALFPKHQRGRITYQKNRWRQKGGGILLAYLKIFAQEGLGRPDLEMKTELDALNQALAKEFPDLELPEPQAALLFYHPDVEVDVDDAPIPTMRIEKIKGFIRQQAKSSPLSKHKAQAIRTLIEGEEDEEYEEDEE